MTSDPLRDDRFPDRPQHPDFWRLSNAVLAHDGLSAEDQRDVTTIAAPYIDVESLVYLCAHRAGQSARLMGAPDTMVPLLFGAMLDGILTGIRFEQDGGHRQ